MPSADAAIFASHWAMLKARRGEVVTYRIGSDSVELTAVMTQPKARQVDADNNVAIESKAWEFLIDPAWPADAPAAFAGVKPSHGDVIEREDGETFRVQPSSPDGPYWRWSDGQHTWRRVFAEES